MKPHKTFRNHPFLAPATLTLLAVGACPLSAQVKLPPLQVEQSNRQGFFVRLGPRIQFDIEARVGVTPETPQVDGQYDNGFVQPDVGGSSTLTWNWGYNDDAQFNGSGIDFERYSNVPHGGVFSGKSDDPVLGGEVMFGMEFSRFAVSDREFAWGVEMGYGFSPFKISNRSTASGTLNYLGATHDLGGVLPPLAPYQGTSAGPGPLIDLQGSTVEYSSTASAAFEGSLKSDLHSFKVGLWVEAPITEKISATLSLGYASVFADTKVDFRESVTIDNPAIPALADLDLHARADNWQLGFYGQLRATWEINEHWGAFVAADYQNNNKFHFAVGGRDVTLDFKNTYGASLGLIFKW